MTSTIASRPWSSTPSSTLLSTAPPFHLDDMPVQRSRLSRAFAMTAVGSVSRWCQQGLMQSQRLLFFAREPLANKTIDFAARDTSMSANANVLDLAAVAQISDMLA